LGLWKPFLTKVARHNAMNLQVVSVCLRGHAGRQAKDIGQRLLRENRLHRAMRYRQALMQQQTSQLPLE
jgi:hypothetical protein